MTLLMPLSLVMVLLSPRPAESDQRIWPPPPSTDVASPSNTPCAGATSPCGKAALPRIRTDDPVLRWLLDTGSSSSLTFRWLVREIERSDLVVYVRIVAMPRAIAGKTAFGTSAGGVRYVQVLLAEPQKGTEALVILAHELQHVLEVARNPLIVDAASMAAQYVRHGAVRKRGTATFVDTTDAVLIGDAVAQQLRGRHWELDQDFARVRASAHSAAVEKQAWQLSPYFDQMPSASCQFPCVP